MAVHLIKKKLPLPDYEIKHVKMPEHDRGGSAEVHANGEHVGYAQFQDGNMHTTVHFSHPNHKKDWERSKAENDHIYDGEHLYHHFSDEDKEKWHIRQRGVQEYQRQQRAKEYLPKEDEKPFVDDDLDTVHKLKESFVRDFSNNQADVVFDVKKSSSI